VTAWSRRLGGTFASPRAFVPLGSDKVAVGFVVGTGILVAASPRPLGVPLLPLVGLAAIAIAGWGFTRHRLGRVLPAGAGPIDPGLLLVAGLAGQACGWAMGAGNSHPSVPGQILFLASYPFAAAGLVSMVRGRVPDRSVDVLVEAVLAGIVVDMVVWTAAVTRHLDGGLGARQIVAALLFPALDAGLIAMAIRVVLVGYDQATGPRALAIGIGAQLAAHVSLAVIALTGWSNPDSAVRLMAVLGIGMSAVGLAHASMAVVFEPQATDRARLSVGHPAIVAGGSLVAPGVLCAQALRHDTLSPGLALGSAALALLMVGHLIHLIRRRADVEHRTEHDPLTGLPNRVLFDDRLEVALARARRNGWNVCVMYLDLDRFKDVNDSLGHAAGDELLRSVARRLRDTVREEDTIARLGGDEFTLLLPQMPTRETVAVVAEKLVHCFATPFVIGGRELFVSTSVGAAVYPLDSDDAESLMTNADAAMYQAKELGRNGFCIYDARMHVTAAARLELGSQLRTAADRDELVLYYQPKVDLRTGRIVGSEALVRWRHPEHGLMSPSEFIPLAEETGIIVELGRWVLERACQQNREWQALTTWPLTVSVNLSVRQFQQDSVTDMVASTLRRTGLEPHCLELELTETMALHGPDAMREALHDLRAMGVQCSIDDFGTGYCGLSHLTRFPLDRLKIDKSFVDQIKVTEADAAVVAAIIAMGHSLGLEVVAEGVETEEQLEYLMSCGCDQVQGYIFSHPLPPDGFADLLADTAERGRATELTVS
jgi:diguanylate cyclase (GGDEF)-like protein